MTHWLTQHVQSLRPDQFPELEFWTEFEALVRRRMRRRGLLESPPRYLGYSGQQWGEVMHDVVFDCYQFAVLDRLVGLRAQLKVKPHIDGLILRNVDHFLLERQRNQDRTGYAIFRNLEMAVLMGIEDGEVSISGGPANRIRNETLLLFDPDASFPGSTAEQVREAVRSIGEWQSRLSEWARISDSAQRSLQHGLTELPDHRVRSCRFKILVDVLKEEVRSVLGMDEMSVQDSQGLEIEAATDFLQAIRTNCGDYRYVVMDQFQDRVKRIRANLSRLEKRDDVMKRVEQLFLELVAVAQSEEPLPSHAELARRMGLPKSSVSDYVQLIRRVWNEVDTMDS